MDRADLCACNNGNRTFRFSSFEAGPLAEQNFRQAMTISAGDWTVFFTRPLSATILALAALALFGPKLYALAVRPKADHVPGDA